MSSLHAVWSVVPTLTPTEALCLLAVDRCGPKTLKSGEPGWVTVDEVTATAGISHGTAGDALRKLAAHGHLEKVPYLSEASNGRPCARTGYRLQEAPT